MTLMSDAIKGRPQKKPQRDILTCSPARSPFRGHYRQKTHRPNVLGALRVAVFTTDRSYEQGVNYRYAELGQARTVSFWPTHT
jgi:hypothetical protein